MKKFVLGTLLFLSIAAVANQNRDLVAKGLRFVAPSVTDKNSIFSPEEGEIVYEAAGSQSKFYGRSNNSWVPLSAGESIFPAGVILPYGGTAEPVGFIFCDGRVLAIADYPDLYAAIGTAFGDGTKNADGTPSGYPTGQAFNVPDLRGRFLRGVDGAAGRDPNKDSVSRPAMNAGGNTGNAVGSVQADAFKSHAHNIRRGNNQGSNQYPLVGWNAFLMTDRDSGTMTNTTTVGLNFVEATGGSETRPVNVYVNYIIKL